MATQSKIFLWFSKITLQFLKSTNGSFQREWNQQHGIYPAWDVQWDAEAWGRGAGRARQAFFSLTNEQVMRNTSKFKQNALWCSIIWLLGFFIAVSLSWTSKSKQWCLLFFNSWVYDDIKVSFSPLGLVSWESFRSAAMLFSTLAQRSVTQLGSAGRQEWAADLMGRGYGQVFL